MYVGSYDSLRVSRNESWKFRALVHTGVLAKAGNYLKLLFCNEM